MPNETITGEAAREELYDVIRRDIPFEQKAREALELGKRYLGVDNGHLTRIDQESQHWKAIASTDSAEGRFPPGLELELGTTYCRRTLESNSQIELHDAPSQGWADDPAFETHGLHCYHGTPLILDNEPYGTVCFVSVEPRDQFSDSETMFAELIARLLERELEREQHEAELTRQTNLATVLNRVLRHNLRNDISVIRGYTQLMADRSNDNTYCETAIDKIDNLINLCQKARELDRIIATDPDRERTDITDLVKRVAERINKEYPNATISVEYDDNIIVAVQPGLERALIELIDNAAKHGGDSPTVTVSLNSVPNAVEIQIVDDGPGLADHEVEVLKTGSETPLTHGSGLGLWLSHWIVTNHGGSIEATRTETGTTMTISLPRKTSPTAHTELSRLIRARDQYQAAFEAANDGMVIINDDARIIDANQAASSIYGLDQQELLGQPLQRFLPDEFDFEAAWSQFKAAGRERDTVTIIGADDVERQVEYSATTDIVPGQHLVASRDITESYRREQESKATIEFLQSLYDVATDRELTSDEKIDQLLEVGPQKLGLPYGHLTRIDGADDEQGTGTQTVIEASGDHKLLQPGDYCPLSRSYCRKTIEQDGLLEIQNAVTDGWADDPAYNTFNLECYIGTTIMVDNELYGTVFFASDTPREEPFTDAERTFVRLMSQLVSYELERRQVTSKLKRQNEQLEEFAGIVSHDLRNPLQVAEGRLELANKEYKSEHHEHIARALEHMNSLINNLLTLSRGGEYIGDLELVELDVLTENCWQNVETAEATLRVESDRVIQADPSRLQQLLENLIRNAIVHGGEDVTVTVGDLADGFYVEDDGTGISEEERDTVFEAGYTTSEDGIGFGLRIVNQVADAHGWEVSVTDSSGGGARFEITGVESDTG